MGRAAALWLNTMLAMVSPTRLAREEELDLHRRLVEEDPVAPSELANAYFGRLIAFLRKASDPQIPPDFIEQAAGEAIVSLIKTPAAFDPSRNPSLQPLFAYLKRAAKGDLINILNSERRHQSGRQSLENVELRSQVRKYVSMDEDPSVALELREEAEKADGQVLSRVRQGLSAGQLRCLDLMLQGERKTAPFAVALGIEQLSPKEQRIEVKRVKDMLKQRIRRTRHG